MTKRTSFVALTGAICSAGLSLPAWAAPTGTEPHAAAGGHGRAAAIAAHVFERMDSNADGQVTRAEADQARERLFASLDADGDGVVSHDEAKTGARALQQKELAARFAELDANGDGKLSSAESKLPPAFFQKLDSNKDGSLSVAEFQARPDVRAEHRELEFARADANHDGKVTRQEAAQAGKERFDRADADHDGVITRAELDAHVAELASAPRGHAEK